MKSPYFNENAVLPELLDIVIEKAPEDRAGIWAELFPDEALDDLKMRHLLSDLMRLVEGFLTIQQVTTRQALADVYHLRALREKGAQNLYLFSQRKLARKRKSPALGSDAYLQAYLLQEEQNTWLRYTANRSGITKLQESINQLDLFYLFNKLKYSCTVLNNRRIMDIDYENVLLDAILEHLEREPYENEPGIAIYYQIYKTQIEPEEVMHYHRLKRLLAAHSEAFEQSEARDMYLFAMNHCIGQINKGESLFLSEIFALYRIVLERELIFEKGRLTPWDFKNIVVVGLRLAEYVWVEGFIRKYKNYIAPEYRENAYTYNLAKLHFYRKEYGEVKKRLQRVEYEDVFYNLDSKVMLLKIYYE
ncbi:MAG: hypothetical protein AAF570_28375, partial [Bacteroidota bacterium]